MNQTSAHHLGGYSQFVYRFVPGDASTFFGAGDGIAGICTMVALKEQGKELTYETVPVLHLFFLRTVRFGSAARTGEIADMYQ
ncbi:MAG: hypothetical protein PHO83_15105 [Geobacteraceae bacterium]|nr:hypothetical protein [Geobacteraceae bacterium]